MKNTLWKASAAPFAGLAVMCVIVLLQLAQPNIIESLSLSVFDSFQRLKPRERMNVPVRIIDIDEESIKARGQWPWPRTDIATMVERLGNLGAAAISFDIVFSEADRTSPHRIIKRLREQGVVDKNVEAAELPDNDRVFAKTIEKWPVVAGFVLVRNPDKNRPGVKPGFAVAGTDPRDALVSYEGSISNLDAIEQASSGIGYFSFEPDRLDRVVRRIPVVAKLGNDLYPSLMLESLRVAQRAGTVILKSSDASGETNWSEKNSMVAVKVGAIEIPTNESGEIWIYHTGHQPSRFISAHEFFDGFEKNSDELRQKIDGHIVLIGTSAAGLLDIVATPVSTSTAGVEVQAEAIEMVLNSQYLVRPDWARGAELAVTVLFSLLLILLMPLIGPLWCAVLGGIIVCISLSSAWFAFSQYKFLFDTVYPLAGATIVYLVVSGVLFLSAESQRVAIRNAFSQYLAPELVKRLADDPAALKLGGEERELTILFSDVRNFTNLSERLNSEDLAELMNAYFTPMTDILLSSQATIDKYIGDAIMAFWNAPLSVESHARRGCEAALEMLQRLEKFRSDQGIDLRIGIGLNTGVCSVGNFGSEQRFNYSALGDPVNLSARIEGQTKLYGAEILIGENTANQVNDFALLEMDIIRVVGKSEPQRIFALLGGQKIAQSNEFLALEKVHSAARAAYRDRKWSIALKEFERALDLANKIDEIPLDYQKVFAVYKERISGFRKKAPPRNWDGVADAETK